MPASVGKEPQTDLQFMILSELKTLLAEHHEKNIHFVLPTGTRIPSHAHVTDVALITKQFIDCGGLVRTESFCRLQIWLADDTEHRVGAKMLLKVLEKAETFLNDGGLEVDVEYEAPFVSQFPITSTVTDGGVLVFNLGIRHTACLAQDRCLPPATKSESPLFRGIPSLQSTKCC